MSDYGDFCREQRAHRQAVRRREATKNLTFLMELQTLGGKPEMLGGGWRIKFADFSVDFWPPSGKWTIVGSNEYSAGPRKMMDAVKERLSDKTALYSAETSKEKWIGAPTGAGNPPWRK